jgi:hypothetical protein
MGLNRIFLLAATVLLIFCGPTSAQKPPVDAGKRNPARDTILRNEPPIASLTASVMTITLPCSLGMVSQSGTCSANVTTAVQLKTIATDPELDALVYKYSANGGRIDGEGTSAGWDLRGLGPGTYRASVEVDDGLGGITNAMTTVTLVACPDCVPACALCPSTSTSCPDAVDQGMPITFTAGGSLGSLQAISYKWTVSVGTITSGQGTSAITVSTDGLGGQNVTATVHVSGLDPACPNQSSCTTAGETAGNPLPQVRRVRQHSLQRREGQTRQLCDSLPERAGRARLHRRLRQLRPGGKGPRKPREGLPGEEAWPECWTRDRD